MFLPLTDGQTMYYEVHGSVSGPVAVVLHGGPGAGLSRRTLKLFDLRVWRVVLYDQRGCGQSTPFGVASLTHNTTRDLLDDMERLRKHLEVDAWYLTGGSWGATLALLYGEAYPKHVLGMLLRAVCLMDRKESAWLYEQNGAAQVFPDAYAKFTAVLPAADRNASMETILKTYQQMLTSSNKAVQTRAAAAWTGYEDSVISLIPKPPVYKGKRDLSVAILENHYFQHGAWLSPDQIVRNAYKLKDIPIDIVHGRYDMICPYRSVQTLAAKLPKLNVLRVDDGGHSGFFETEAHYIREITDAIGKGFHKKRKTSTGTIPKRTTRKKSKRS